MRRLLVVLLALLLPLANAWGLLAPCPHGLSGEPSSAAAHPAAPCHDGAPAPEIDRSAHDGTCSNCAHCQLSATPLPLNLEPVLAPRAHAVEHAHLAAAQISFIPRLPLPPPVA